jgi:hypothetical protein
MKGVLSFLLRFLVIYGLWSAGEWAVCYARLRSPVKGLTPAAFCTKVVLFPFNF